MKRLRNLMMASAAMALVIGAMGAPAAAAPAATLAIVHGIPGVKVDVCVNGGVLQKDFKYAQKIVLDNALPAGKYKVTVKQAVGAKPCKGETLLKLKTALTGTENLTVVAGFKNGKPGLRIFDHAASLGVSPVSTSIGTTSAIIATHAARAGKVDVYAATVVVAPSSPTPTVEGLRRGTAVGLFAPPTQWSTWIAAPGTIKPIIGPVYRATKAGKINHYVAVGSDPSNFSLVFFRTALDIIT